MLVSVARWPVTYIALFLYALSRQLGSPRDHKPPKPKSQVLLVGDRASHCHPMAPMRVYRVEAVVCRSALLIPGDAPALGEGDEAAREAEEGQDEHSLFQESEHPQVETSQRWVACKGFTDHLALVRIPHRFVYRWLQQQLRLSGAAWEKREQKSMLDTGTRKYRILEAYDSRDTEQLFEKLTHLMYDEGSWTLIQEPDENKQKMAFITLCRCIAMAHQLVYFRNTNYPYRTFDCLRDVDSFQRLARADACTMDEYTENFVRYYGESVGNALSRTELELLLALGDTDTVSTERAHSVNNVKAGSRKLSHKLDLPTLDAYWVGRHARGPTDDSAEGATRGGRKRAIEAPAAGGPGPRRRNVAGAWRAFVHVQSAGQRFDAGSMRELSLQFRSLSDAEKDYYNELGLLGRELHRTRGHSFERSRRKGATPKPHLLRKYGRGGDAGQLSLQDGRAAADDEGEGPASALTGSERIALSSRALLAAERSADRQRKLDEEAAASRVEAHSGEHAAGIADAFGWQRCGRTDVMPMAGIQLKWHVPAESVTTWASRCVAAKTKEESALTWRSLHKCIMDRECESLGKVTTQRRWCWEAGVCVHGRWPVA